jgi:mannonate dehydratase
MRMSFRWFGGHDRIPLRYIKQIPGVRSIVSALYDIPVGHAWPAARVRALRDEIEDAGMQLAVVESIPVHEDIKLGLPSREKWTEMYCASISALGQAGIPVLCYNFMPVFDWTRTDLSYRLQDGSTALAFNVEEAARIDLSQGTRDLPGWATAYDRDQLNALLHAYRSVDEEKLWDNLAWFLDQIVPAAEAADVKLAMLPDDPPWSIFGLPRILTDGAALDRFIDLNDSHVSGVTFCTGSLAPTSARELPQMVRELGGRGRIHFAHCRNVRITGPQSFHETAHPTEHGDVNMIEVLRALMDTDFDGCIRPDHGRMIWGEAGMPGYGLYDRALGAMYLQGLWEGLVSSTAGLTTVNSARDSRE